jgi:hypothetical protein
MSVAPKVVPQDLEDEIVMEQYNRIPNTNVTVCTLQLKNGIIASGINHGSVDPANFNEQIGKDYSRKGAIEKMWPLLGFRLADKLHAIRSAGAPSGKILTLGSPVTHLTNKVIHTVAMTRQEYNDYRGWQLPADENGDDNGYLVEYADGGKSNVEGHTGYVSWSPADVLERASGVSLRQEPETFLTRLEKERDRTVSDLNKLTAFLDGDVSKLAEEAVADLHLQKDIMTQLAFILSKRYDDLTTK